MLITKKDLEESLAATAELQQLVSAKKYQLKGEQTFSDVLERVIRYIESYGGKHGYDIVGLGDLLRKGLFIPAGSILYGLGNDEVKCSLSNCYVTPIENDSIEGIFDALKKSARTYSYRGGVGMDITILRPRHARVNNAAKSSSGAVSFMPLFSEVTNSIGQSGRRGALLLSIDVRHPDVLDFIKCKSDPESVFGRDPLTGKLPDVFGANISVKLTDKFLEAVETDENWDLIFPDRDADPELYDEHWKGDYTAWEAKGGTCKLYETVRARDVMNAIAECAHQSGDPGVLFIDTVHRYTPSVQVDPERLTPHTTNPCGEQPIAPYNNCLLGALVLHKYVSDPFTPKAEFDATQFMLDVKKAVSIMNILSDINVPLHPLYQQRDQDAYGKRIGIEITGLGDTLAMLGYEYGSEDACAFVSYLMRGKALAELEASASLAKQHGPCLAMGEKEARYRFLRDSAYTKFIDPESALYNDIAEYGLANVSLNTVGPTGSISIMSDNCTSGIEPLFMLTYTRKTRLSDSMYTMIHKPAIDFIQKHYSEEELEKGVDVEHIRKELGYIESHDLSWKKRIKMQATVQRYTDSSISSTVNLPNSATPAEIQEIYMSAWVHNLKGITVFRDGCKRGVLSSSTPTEAPAIETPTVILKELLEEERARRYKVAWKGAKIYITVTLDDDDLPLEVFVKLPREAGINGGGVYSEETFQEKYSLWETITRLVSLLLRVGMPLDKIIEQLEKSTYSLVDAAAILIRILRKFMLSDTEDMSVEDILEHNLGKECQECGVNAYVFENGCGVCKNCGYTTCG